MWLCERVLFAYKCNWDYQSLSVMEREKWVTVVTATFCHLHLEGPCLTGSHVGGTHSVGTGGLHSGPIWARTGRRDLFQICCCPLPSGSPSEIASAGSRTWLSPLPLHEQQTVISYKEIYRAIGHTSMLSVASTLPFCTRRYRMSVSFT